MEMKSHADKQGVYRLPDSLPDDLARLRQLTVQFKQGSIDAAKYKAFRVPQGVYEQRESGAYMLRVRLPAGMILPHQMRTLAKASLTYGDGVLHVTSRQDIQIHRVSLDSIDPALTTLSEVGLSTKGGGGNTVRNITGCCAAGVCPKEVFDVTPHVVALTELLVADPLSYQLPRKYKIALSGCGKDCAGATVNDLGLVAKRREGVEGFTVYVGGGMGARSRVAVLLEEFIPASEAYLVAEAVKRVFDKHGDRTNRHKARLRFLIEETGLDAFRKLYAKELKDLRRSSASRPAPRAVPRPPPPVASDTTSPSERTEDFRRWQETSVTPQRQAGYHVVEVPLFLGDIDAEKLHGLADVVERHGECALRATQRQNLLLRWVPGDALAELYHELSALGLSAGAPRILRNMVACAGASTCRLGICLSRELAKAIMRELTRSGLDLQDDFGELEVFISGCPNACARHPIAPIGFFGTARRVEGRSVPHYVLQLGGRAEEGKTQLARGRQKIPARSIPAFLVDFLKGYRASPQFPDFYAFLEADGRKMAEQLHAPLRAKR